MRSVWTFSLAKSISSARQCRQISSAASLGMTPSRACARASAASKSRYFWTVLVRKHAPHRLGGKDVAKHGGIDQRGGHRAILRKAGAHVRDVVRRAGGALCLTKWI